MIDNESAKVLASCKRGNDLLISFLASMPQVTTDGLVSKKLQAQVIGFDFFNDDKENLLDPNPPVHMIYLSTGHRLHLKHFEDRTTGWTVESDEVHPNTIQPVTKVECS